MKYYNEEKKERTSSTIWSYAALGALVLVGYKFGFNAGVNKVVKNTNIVANVYSDMFKLVGTK